VSILVCWTKGGERGAVFSYESVLREFSLGFPIPLLGASLSAVLQTPSIHSPRTTTRTERCPRTLLPRKKQDNSLHLSQLPLLLQQEAEPLLILGAQATVEEPEEDIKTGVNHATEQPKGGGQKGGGQQDGEQKPGNKGGDKGGEQQKGDRKERRRDDNIKVEGLQTLQGLRGVPKFKMPQAQQPGGGNNDEQQQQQQQQQPWDQQQGPEAPPYFRNKTAMQHQPATFDPPPSMAQHGTAAGPEGGDAVLVIADGFTRQLPV